MNLKRKLTIITLIILGLMLIIPTIVLAETPDVTYDMQIGIPGSGDFDAGETLTFAPNTNYIGRYISAIYDYAMKIIGIIATIMLMIGGLIWATSGGDKTKVGQAKEIINASISGMVLLATAYLILSFINPALVSFHIKGIDKIEGEKTTTTKPFCSKIQGPIESDTPVSFDKVVKCPKNKQCIKVGDYEKTHSCTCLGENYECVSNAICCRMAGKDPLSGENAIFYNSVTNTHICEKGDKVSDTACSGCIN